MLRTTSKISLKLLSVALLSAAFMQSHATGLMECGEIDKASWQTKEALIKHLENDGWTQIRKVKVDGGCYEAYATTPEGDKVEAYFNPATFEKLLVARRGIVLFKKRVLFEKGSGTQE